LASGESTAFALATFDSATSIRLEIYVCPAAESNSMYSGQNKTAGLKHQFGCMTAAACRHDFPAIPALNLSIVS
jgi:hypothetical protein